MQIASSTNSIFAAYTNDAASRSTRAAASDAATVASATSAPSFGVQSADFNNMTRQQLFDWMNSQLKSGAMTFDQSSSFLGMTMKVSVATGRPADMATDTQIHNFTEVARQGLEGARSRNDEKQAQALEQALAIMQREQGTVTKVDMTA